MHYVALVGEHERQVEITDLGTGAFRVVIDGRPLEVDARLVSETTFSLLMGEQAYNIETEVNPNGAGDNILVRGHLVNVEVLDLRTLRLRKVQEESGGPEGPVQVTAPMPGKVVDVLVEEGQQVVEGQGLVIVEAMKMENELRAPRAGTIKNLQAVKGTTVENGVALCVIE